MYLNPCLFVFFQDAEIVLWDYKRHQQFFLNQEYLLRLVEFSKDLIFQPDNPVDIHFLEEGIIQANPPLFNLFSDWGWDPLSHIFHVGTKDVPVEHSLDNGSQFVEQYVRFCEETAEQIAEINTEKKGDIYELPEPDLSVLGKTTLEFVLHKRMTSRFFYPESLSLEEFSHLLYATFGHIHGSWLEMESLGLKLCGVRKSSPSAGGLHASEAYVLANNIVGLPRGIYHYRSHQHVLSLVSSDWDASRLSRLLSGQPFAENISLGIFITSRFDKLWSKYPHSRAYRVALLDIGHLSQTFQLCATGMNLECWLTGAFLDTEVNQMLNIDGTSEQVMFFLGAGKGRRQFLDEKTLAFLKSS